MLNSRFHNLLPRNFHTPLNLRFLGLGPKFCPRPYEPHSSVYQKAIKDFIYRIKIHDFARHLPDNSEYNPKLKMPLSRWRPNQLSVPTHNFIRCIEPLAETTIRNRLKPLKPPDALFKYCKNIKNSPYLKVTNSDKNTGLTIMHIREYNKCVLQHLNNPIIYTKLCRKDDPYWELENELIIISHDLLKDNLIKQSYFSKQAMKYFETIPNILPKFHVLPKLHKTGSATRPIIGSPSWITTKWSIFLESELAKFKCKYVIENSQNLVKKVEGMALPKGCWLCSADVTSLYTNMDLGTLYTTILKKTGNITYIDILQFICENNYFEYAEEVYQQRNGIAMGTNVAVRCANLYLDLFDEYFAPQCLFYCRYIDDIFFVFPYNIIKFIKMKIKMNNFVKGIKLTIIRSTDSVNFLDLTIKRNVNDKIKFCTFRKPTNIYQYLPLHSNHSRATISGFIFGELLRHVRNNTRIEDRIKNMHIFYLHLLRRGYPRRYLHRIFLKLDIHQRSYSKESETKKIIPLIIPYYPSPLTRALIDIVHQANNLPEAKHLNVKLIVAFKKSPNILNLCSNSTITTQHITTLRNEGC